MFGQPIPTPFLPGYCLRRGRQAERGRLLAFMTRTYQEMCPQGEFGHLERTVEQFLGPEAPFWFVEPAATQQAVTQHTATPSTDISPAPIACLWLGRAVDQSSGQGHTHILLLYVDPPHRRQGLGSALVTHAETWAIKHGEHQLGLQVFVENRAARRLYEQQGFACQSMWMTKILR